MKKVNLILGKVLGLIMFSAITIYTQPVTIHINMEDFMKHQEVLTELGLAIPSGFTTLPKGQNINTKIANTAWLIENGWRDAAKGDKLSVTCTEKGVWSIESTTPDKPFSIHVHMEDFMQPQAVLTELGLAIPSGFTTLPKGQNINTEIANPAWLIENGWRDAAMGDKLSVTCIEKGLWSIESTTTNKPFSIHVHMDEFY